MYVVCNVYLTFDLALRRRAVVATGLLLKLPE